MPLLAVDTAAAPESVRVAGIVVAAALAAAALLARTSPARAWAMLVALVAIPLALLFVRRPAALPLAALATLPFRVPIEAGGATANLLVPLYLVVAAGALAWAVPRVRDGDAFDPPAANGALEWLLAGSVLLYALQTSYSSDVDKALEQTVFFYVPFTLLFAVLRDVAWTPRLMRTGLYVLVALALVFVGIGFVEYATRSLLFNPKVIASNQLEAYFRVNSLFFDPNIYGRFLALVMLGLATVLLWERRSRAVGPATVAIAVLWGGLVLTLSQSSFAALLCGLLVLAALRFSVRVVWPAAALIAVAGIVVVLAFPGALRLDLGSSRSLDHATSGRYDLMRGGIDLARDRPLAGWGSAAFSEEYLRHGFGGRSDAVSASHTIPITVAAEQGIVGLAVYVALLGAALSRLLGRARGNPWRAAVAAGFVAVLVHTWMYASFLEDPVTWALLAVGTVLARAPLHRARPPAADGEPALV